MQTYHYLHIIDDRKIVTPLQDKCIRSVVERKRAEDTHEICIIPYSDDINKQIYLADCCRLEKAYSCQNLVYCDTDLFLSKPLHEMILSEGFPYYGEYTYNTQHHGMADIYFFYVNNCCDYFRKFLSTDKLSPDKYSFSINDLKSLTDYKLFNNLDYCHMYTTIDKQDNLHYIKKLECMIDTLQEKLG
jgi:hypothetical protein